MSGRIRRWKFVRASALIVLIESMLVPGRAWGQVQVNFRDEGAGAWPWLVAVLLILLVAGVGFLNAKRTHLD